MEMWSLAFQPTLKHIGRFVTRNIASLWTCSALEATVSMLAS
jgi:hypothetical protein